MNESAIISLVAMLGWLVLMIFGFRSYRVEGRKALGMALIWVWIFLGVFLLFWMFQ